ncbi:Mre11-DNA-bind domain-containing protein [Aphelenchoides fujianensis]|nr:Mre11-DNA-bind domain-containing protein [Aphelenchoides fujianensis]
MRVMQIFRKHVFSGPSTELEFASKPENSFAHSAFKLANFEDPNYCVSMPVFSIHGNHDDLSGTNTSALDVLHQTGLLNLFGRFGDVDHFEVKPILVRKTLADGTTENVALYGISSQRDDRLARAFNDGKVVFVRPPDVENWFSLLVLHQNRPPRSHGRSTGSYIGAQMIPSFIDLVIWGHEHESIPGSSGGDPDGRDGPRERRLDPAAGQHGGHVAGAPGEAKPKHCFLITLHGNRREPEVSPIPLRTTRRVVVEEWNLDEQRLTPPSENVRLADRMEDERYFHGRMKAILQQLSREPNTGGPALPLIRIKLVYSGSWQKIPMPNVRKIGAPYSGQVANPTEILSVKRERAGTRRAKGVDTRPLERAATGKAADFIQQMANGPLLPADLLLRLQVNEHFNSLEDNEGKMHVLRKEVLVAALSEFYRSHDKTTTLESKFKEAIRKSHTGYCEQLDDATEDSEFLPTTDGFKDYEHRVEGCVMAGDSATQLTQDFLSQYGLSQSQTQQPNGAHRQNGRSQEEDDDDDVIMEE